MLTKARNVVCVLLGAAGLVLKGRYSGPYEDLIRGYGGNIAASFAVYFLITLQFAHSRSRRLLTAALALAVVELFELLDGFGVMTNVYDRVDLAANAVGIALALAVDTATRRVASPAAHASEQPVSGTRG